MKRLLLLATLLGVCTYAAATLGGRCVCNPGADGPKGAIGPNGMRGDIGLPGERGPDGWPGQMGQKGEPGMPFFGNAAAGPPGQMGDTGLVGPPGPAAACNCPGIPLSAQGPFQPIPNGVQGPLILPPGTILSPGVTLPPGVVLPPGTVLPPGITLPVGTVIPPTTLVTVVNGVVTGILTPAVGNVIGGIVGGGGLGIVGGRIVGAQTSPRVNPFSQRPEYYNSYEYQRQRYEYEQAQSQKQAQNQQQLQNSYSNDPNYPFLYGNPNDDRSYTTTMQNSEKKTVKKNDQQHAQAQKVAKPNTSMAEDSMQKLQRSLAQLRQRYNRLKPQTNGQPIAIVL